MKLLRSLAVILAIKIVFSEAEKWSNDEVPTHSSENSTATSGNAHTEKVSLCDKLVSRKISVYVPYEETFRTDMWSFHQIKTRYNFRREYRVKWDVEKACCGGYQQVGTECRPLCSPSCGKTASCVSPNMCRCNAGYQMKDGRCKPVCANGCINGTCIEPDICICDANHFMSADGVTCKPVCPDMCEKNGGFCQEPNVCSCYPGYKMNATKDHYECLAVCDRDCTNGYCIMPDRCKCMNGYEPDKFDPFTCKPTCIGGCKFGSCVAPDTCVCYIGYKQRITNVCMPLCSQRCKMGICVAPEICQCWDGYGLLGNSRYVCERILQQPCKDGLLFPFGRCICDSRSVYDERESRCVCAEGYYSSSVKTDRQSLDNATRSKRICKPICNVPCGNNSACTAPDVCTCKDGFAQGKGSVCEPTCENGCENGDCVGPNVCVCRENFVLKTDDRSRKRCVPECTRDCSGHGSCREDTPSICDCYLGWTGFNCDQPTLCVATLVHFNRNDTISLHSHANSTIMRAIRNAPRCHLCNSSLGNESSCYMIHSNFYNAPFTVSCLLSTDLPCYMAPRYNVSPNVAGITWPVASVAVLSAIGLTAMYTLYRIHQRKKLAAGNSTLHLIQDSSVNESLMCENT